MQRLSFAFPGSIPGSGLLLLRIAVSLTALYEEHFPLLTRSISPPAFLLLKVGGFMGVMFVGLGLLTRIGCALLAAGTLVVLHLSSVAFLNVTAATLLPIELLVMIVVTAAVGPGAFSIDARLFGRRKIIFPS